MNEFLGLGKKSREQLSLVLREMRGVITVKFVSETLNLSVEDAAKHLSKWCKHGWVSRLKRGVYIPVPLESGTAEVAIEDPWVVATQLFSLCYIGGWSAAEHWDFTEQIFNSIAVMTTHQQRKKEQILKNTPFLLRTITSKKFFGIKSVWRGNIKVSLSDPTKTIIDMLDDPQVGGGIRPTVDVLLAYFSSEYKNENDLKLYSIQMGNGAIFKRLGFILETWAPEYIELIRFCRDNLSTGSAKIDPNLVCSKWVSRWRLLVPENL